MSAGGSRSSNLQLPVQVAAGRSTHQQQPVVQVLEVDEDMEIEEIEQTNACDNDDEHDIQEVEHDIHEV